MDPILRIILIIGAFVYLFIILWMLKKGKLNVQYSIIWLASAGVFLLIAFFPFIIYKLVNVFHIEMPVNLVFLVIFAFVLLLLLSLSIIVTGFSSRIRKLSQTQALLEKRVRELEDALEKKSTQIDSLDK